MTAQDGLLLVPETLMTEILENLVMQSMANDVRGRSAQKVLANVMKYTKLDKRIEDRKSA